MQRVSVPAAVVRSAWARLGAGLVYGVTPFVYERLWAGQVAFLLAYALLPWAIHSLQTNLQEPGWRRIRPVLPMLCCVLLSTHFVFILAVTVVALVAVRGLGRHPCAKPRTATAVARSRRLSQEVDALKSRQATPAARQG